MRAHLPPIALTIAGSDSSAGAGIQADLKTFTAFGVYGLTALTCVVAEVPGRVLSIQGVDIAVLRDQIVSALEAFPVRAIKTGLLHSRAAVELVTDLYRALTIAGRPPLVIDPVLVASSGDRLLDAEALPGYVGGFFQLATLITPNLDETRTLLDCAPIRDARAMQDAAHKLASRFGTSFLIKGGHLPGEKALDILVHPGGEMHTFETPFLPGKSPHGTGCTYSAAIAAGLAHGKELKTAIAKAKTYMHQQIANAIDLQENGVPTPSVIWPEVP